MKISYTVIILLFILLLSSVEIGHASAIQWYNHEDGVNLAKTSGKPIILFFSSQNSGMPFDDSEVIEMMKNFIPIKVDANSEKDRFLIRLYHVSIFPTLFFMDKEGKLIQKVNGFMDTESLKKVMTDSLNKKGDKKKIVDIENLKNAGSVTIKELKESPDVFDYQIVEITGIIRNIKFASKMYSFVIDDGSDTMPSYSSGLGDIKDGDKVFVKGIYSNGLYVNTISKTSFNDITSNVGLKSSSNLGILFALFALFLVRVFKPGKGTTPNRP